MSSQSDQEHLDARATEYVFGELTGIDLISFEKEMEKSAELREAVDSVREAVSALENEFAEEAKSLPTVDKDPTIMASAQVPSNTANSASRMPLISLTVAASVLLVGGLIAYPWFAFGIRTTAQSARETSQLVADRAEMEAFEDYAAEGSAEGSAEGGGSGSYSAPRRRANLRRSITGKGSEFGLADKQAQQAAQASRFQSGIRDQKSKPSSNQPKPNRPSPSHKMPPLLSQNVTSLPGVATKVEKKLGDIRKSDVVVRGGQAVAAAKLPKPNAAPAPITAQFLPAATPGNVPRQPFSNSLPNHAWPPDRERQVRFAENSRRVVVLSDSIRTPLLEGFEQENLDVSGLGVTAEAKHGDRFAAIHDNPFREVSNSPLSTFSIDVDTASYSKVRMYLAQHQRLPQPDAVRIEELINYFDYDYEPPTGEHPFSAAMEVATCPWDANHRLARIGIKGKVIESDRPASNLVFLLDVSGSMNQSNKLPLVIDGMKTLVGQLSENDSVAIVVYAGAAGLILDSTSGNQKKVILDALDRLQAGGSTAGAQGIQRAYEVARDNFITGGTNRVILCTDGDFNVGVTNTDELVQLAADNAKGNIFLSVLGYGSGNHNDAMMEKVSNRANGNYAFIDTAAESEKVFVEQMLGTLVTIAKDVKIQIEFNPAEIASYRLIGYENRVMANKDFDDDKKDAGEIGAGHTVTALYELIPASQKSDALKDSGDSGLRYQNEKTFELNDNAKSGELLTLKMRYKEPTESKSKLIEFSIKDSGQSFSQADQDFQFAASVAAFGMLLRNSPHKGDANYDSVEELAIAGAQGDTVGYRTEFVEMVKRAKQISGR